MQSIFLNPIHIVRSFAILLVVLNHTAALGPNLHGGMNLLVNLSGYSFALVMNTSNWTNAVHSYSKMAAKLLTISFILALFTISLKLLLSYDVKGNILFELAHISNLFYAARNVSFPIWFVQCTVQFSILLFLTTYIFKVTFGKIKVSLLLGVPALLIVAILPVILYNLFDLTHLKGKTPDVYLSNFAIGIILYFTKIAEDKKYKILGFITLCTLIFTIFIMFDIDGYGAQRYISSQICIMLVVFVNHIHSIRIVHYLVTFLSLNAIGIFFLHNYVITCFRVLFDMLFNLNIFDYWYIMFAPVLIFLSIFLIILYIGFDIACLFWKKVRISRC